MSNESTNQASSKERHDILYDSAKDILWKSIEFEFKEATVLLVVIGWIMTARSAQDVIASSIALRIALTVVLAFLAVCHAVYVRMFFNRSTKIHRALRQLDYMPIECHESIRIPVYFAILLCVWHLVTTAVIILAIWLTPFMIEAGGTTP